MPQQRKSWIKLFLITIVGSFLEAVGVGLVVPFISFIVSTKFALPYFITELWPQIATVSKSELVIVVILIFLSFYLFKSLFALWLLIRQTSFYYSLQESITGRLFRSYLSKDYTFHLTNNSAKLLSNTITESMQFSVGYTAPLLFLLNDVFIAVFILIVLFIVEPISALIAILSFGSLSVFLFAVSKKKSANWGTIRQSKERLRIKSAQEGFNGIKDIKLSGRDDIFIDQYLKHTNFSLEAGRNQSILQQIPKISLEFVAVFSLCGIVIFLYLFGDSGKVISVLGVFSAAAFKLLPTVSRLVQSCQGLVFQKPVVSLIHEELVSIKSPAKPINCSSNKRINFEGKLTISDLSFCYDGSNKSAIQNINFDLAAGKMFGFIGSSGAGKSTLIDCILGLIEPSSGSLSVDGEVITKGNVKKWQKNIGYVPQVIYLLDASLRENIAFGISADFIDDEKLKSAINKAQLSDFISDLPKGLDTFVGERGVRLSGGQRQRIGIARALYNAPSVLVLDEATSALDNETESEVMNAVESLQGSRTILIIAHRFSTIKNCDYIYKLENGRVVLEGNPNEVLGKKLLTDE